MFPSEFCDWSAAQIRLLALVLRGYANASNPGPDHFAFYGADHVACKPGMFEDCDPCLFWIDRPHTTQFALHNGLPGIHGVGCLYVNECQQVWSSEVIPYRFLMGLWYRLEIVAVVLDGHRTHAACQISCPLRPVYTCDFWCDFKCDIAHKTRLTPPYTNAFFANHRVDWK